MQGKQTDAITAALDAGITPAYAGKTIPEVPVYKLFQDHPRVCGENDFARTPR